MDGGTAPVRSGGAVGIAAALVVPLLVLGVLLAVPPLDGEWHHEPSHFWLVLLVAVGEMVLGLVIGDAAERHGDARTLGVSLVLLVTAGFLGLHALATPGVLLGAPNLGFAIATPVGLAVASVLAFASTAARGMTTVRSVRLARGAVAAVLLAWGAASLAELAGLDGPPEEVAPSLILLAAPGTIVLYLIAAWRYVALHRVRRDALPLAIAVAFVLLAEAMAAVMVSRAWRASWWEWHVLITAAFVVVFVVARRAYRSERSVSGALRGLYLDRTLAQLDEAAGAGLRQLVEARRTDGDHEAVAARLRRRGMGAEEVRALERSAAELVRVDALFGHYVGPELVERLVADPGRAQLGGREADVSVLFADLAGFTAFSEGRAPSEVVEMLNGYWERAVPAVTGEPGGLVERFAGDAVLVVFNALGDQSDHPTRAVRGALAMRTAVAEVAAAHPDWPRFRIGVNSGRAVVGNVGSDDRQSFTVIGDAVNVAARAQSAATPGEIVAAEGTARVVGHGLVADEIGPVTVKGRSAPVALYRVHDLR